MYDRNILGSPSVVFGNLRQISGNVRKHSSGLRRKVVGNLRKIVTFYIIKKKLHGCAEIRNLSCRKIFQHSTINFFSPRGHVISSISLPSPPSEVQLKDKTETGDGSGYTLELTDTLIHWIISMQRKLTFFPHYNSGRNHWILNSIDINRAHKVLLLFSQGWNYCHFIRRGKTLFRVFGSDKWWRSWSDGPFKERALVFRGEISCFQQYTKKCFLPVFTFISSFSLVDVCVCVFLFLFWRGGGGGGGGEGGYSKIISVILAACLMVFKFDSSFA